MAGHIYKKIWFQSSLFTWASSRDWSVILSIWSSSRLMSEYRDPTSPYTNKIVFFFWWFDDLNILSLSYFPIKWSYIVWKPVSVFQIPFNRKVRNNFKRYSVVLSHEISLFLLLVMLNIREKRFYFFLHLYINLACLSVCLSVCLFGCLFVCIQ